MQLRGSVRSKLLLAFAASLTAITLVNTALMAYLIGRQGEDEAFNRLSQQLMQLQDDMQETRDALVAVAQEAASDERTLSDLAILYSESLAQARRQDDTRDRALTVHKTVSLNRLHLILGSAQLSSLAVYMNGTLSHYVTPDEAGMSVRRGRQPLPIITSLKWSEQNEPAGLQDWPEHRAPAVIASDIPDVDHVTTLVYFPSRQTLVLRIVVPIQAVTRESFNDTIAENLAIATPENLRPLETGGPAPQVIGQYVFSKTFDRNFLQEMEAKTGILPALLSADGTHRFDLVGIAVPSSLLSTPTDVRIKLGTADIGDQSYYQGFKRWRIGNDATLILGGALSRAGTLATIRRTTFFGMVAAAVILAIGMALGSVLITRMVTPIKALTAAATSMRLDTSELGMYLESPVQPQSTDEIGELTFAFNKMAGRLHALNTTLEQQVRDRTAQLETANRELESFSYSVSHDLRAPLRSLDGFSRALLEDYGRQLDENGRHYLRRIRVASQHMTQLIDDMLNLARVSRADMHRTAVDLTALAREVADELRRNEPDRDIQIVIAPNLQANGDPRLLQVMLENLLNNAWKFTSTRASARIECGELIHNGTRAFFVRDDGVGFDMAYAHKLFVAFQRLHTVSEFPGTGIGLATVQRIVQRHGGHVWAESELEHGATFYFTLPDDDDLPSAA